ncbi:MAG: hypothetical protein IPL46_20545 [Saprospiraceae bacterium]|nr:hypothetical protein [Saprospiraceae bacterium]
MNFKFTVLVFLSISLYLACSKESTDQISKRDSNDLDNELVDALDAASPSGRFFHFILADENKFEFLPNQDPSNRVTREKVKLGRAIFFDTGLAQDARDKSCYETYSCSTCHVPEKGFLPGRMQGIADGAPGFGEFGSTKYIGTLY